MEVICLHQGRGGGVAAFYSLSCVGPWKKDVCGAKRLPGEYLYSSDESS